MVGIQKKVSLHHHYHHLFWKRHFFHAKLELDVCPYEIPPYIPENCPLGLQTKHFHVIIHTFFPSLPIPPLTSHPHHLHEMDERWHGSLFQISDATVENYLDFAIAVIRWNTYWQGRMKWSYQYITWNKASKRVFLLFLRYFQNFLKIVAFIISQLTESLCESSTTH